jgi:hypothetical protein
MFNNGVANNLQSLGWLTNGSAQGCFQPNCLVSPHSAAVQRLSTCLRSTRALPMRRDERRWYHASTASRRNRSGMMGRFPSPDVAKTCSVENANSARAMPGYSLRQRVSPSIWRHQLSVRLHVLRRGGMWREHVPWLRRSDRPAEAQTGSPSRLALDPVRARPSENQKIEPYQCFPLRGGGGVSVVSPVVAPSWPGFCGRA